MKSYFLLTDTGLKVILTSYDSVEHPALLRKFQSEGIEKFIAYEMPLGFPGANYGKYFDIACSNLNGGDGFLGEDCISECSH